MPGEAWRTSHEGELESLIRHPSHSPPRLGTLRLALVDSGMAGPRIC